MGSEQRSQEEVLTVWPRIALSKKNILVSTGFIISILFISANWTALNTWIGSGTLAVKALLWTSWSHISMQNHCWNLNLLCAKLGGWNRILRAQEFKEYCPWAISRRQTGCWAWAQHFVQPTWAGNHSTWLYPLVLSTSPCAVFFCHVHVLFSCKGMKEPLQAQRKGSQTWAQAEAQILYLAASVS